MKTSLFLKLLAAAALYGTLVGASQATLGRGDIVAGREGFGAAWAVLAGLLLIASRRHILSKKVSGFALGGVVVGAGVALAYGLTQHYPEVRLVPSLVGYAAVGMFLSALLAASLKVPMVEDEPIILSSLCWIVLGSLLAAGMTDERTHQTVWTVLAGTLGGVVGSLYGPVMHSLQTRRS